MAKRHNDGLTGQAKEREATNATGVAGWENEKAARQANAAKQKRYRESMKAQGYKAHLIWEKPLPPGTVKASACIHESSRGIANDKDSGKPLYDLGLAVFRLYKENRISKELYQDIQELLKPLGDLGL
jgi:hypothetical protein